MISEDASWDSIREEIKAALEKNITLFLNQKPPPNPVLPTTRQTTASGFKMPPFPKRADQPGGSKVPLSTMTPEQAEELKQSLFALLAEFDANSSAPFTIQRICELCLFPQAHYNTTGKYLRAMERSLLVTGTWADHKAPEGVVQQTGTGYPGFVSIASAASSVPSTPLFSPIPFLHEDARRSQSLSPPPSPLSLSTIGPSSGGHPDLQDIKPLGLVDELDDPGPGHLSDHPIAISSVTTLEGSEEMGQKLEERFISAAEKDEQMEDTAMDEDKENQG
ncbi:PPP4R2-domain-containing protein [Flagelloscypha sp. PMI_526]|nr:PPP4R2-domain-containing protein [Flagelloscypha sp. PMI_526]